MADLYVVRGDSSYEIMRNRSRSFVYLIGTERPLESPCVLINDGSLLHKYAVEIRNAYVQWICEFNERFLAHGLRKDDLSLFYLTDLSCKRTELFDTYSTICNLLVIKEKLQGEEIENAILVGLDRSFCIAFRSMFPKSRISTIDERGVDALGWKHFCSDIRYLLEIVGVGLINRVESKKKRSIDRKGERYFFSPYPQNLSLKQSFEEDIKYRDLVGDDDRYAVSIIMDGFHQNVSLRRYLRLRKDISKKRYCLIDNYLTVVDAVHGLFWMVMGIWFLSKNRKEKYVFHDTDLTGYIRQELIVSLSRLTRLMVMERSLRRFCSNFQIREFIYYLHEYPVGRLISYVLGTGARRVRRTGFQHGPASWRKLLYFLADSEASTDPPYLYNVPIPDYILAEDLGSAQIYEYSGYKNVRVMDKVHRLNYLNGLETKQDPCSAVIVPGLHDGKVLLSVMINRIKGNPGITYYFRPHPRANNSYTSAYKGYPNLTITSRPIVELLQQVSKVYVTYSSVGPEAKSVGLDVDVVNIPGKINESPLIDEGQTN